MLKLKNLKTVENRIISFLIECFHLQLLQDVVRNFFRRNSTMLRILPIVPKMSINE
jgi:hypothetical protein